MHGHTDTVDYFDLLIELFPVGGTQNKINIISIFSAIISPPELIQAPL